MFFYLFLSSVLFPHVFILIDKSFAVVRVLRRHPPHRMSHTLMHDDHLI